ncbi:uncharacterized protein LOC128176928 [Crassostrea angulata]|uniref:uncharacterized protein LOC128176928 n=1 Tax=Magallana angulata TaxID=2784310 RepID=UPI0022B1C348|nr:uncharacterized protein LOC128176928 [Crassostrea angulata]
MPRPQGHQGNDKSMAGGKGKDEQVIEETNTAAASKELIEEEKKGKVDKEENEDHKKAAATKDIVEEYKEGNEENEDSKKKAATKDIVEEYKRDNDKGGNEENIEATESEDRMEEYQEGKEKIEEALKTSDTEDVDSNFGSPSIDGDELTSGDESYITCDEGGVVSGDESTTATGNETPPSSGRCGTANEMGAGGARPKELKGILAIKLKTKKKNIKSAIPEIHPAVPPKKKNIIFDFSEEDSEEEHQTNEVPKKFHIDFDPVMTVRFCYDSRDEESENEEPEVNSPGREFIEDIECRLQEDITFTPQRGDQHRSSFRHQQTVGSIAETTEWYLSEDDLRYGVHRTYSDPVPQESCLTIFKTNMMDCFCCCCTPSTCCCCTPSTCCREHVEPEIREATQHEDVKENGGIESAAEPTIESISLNDNATEKKAKPKRVGRMKRIRRFFRRLFCCTGCRED